MKQTNPRRGVAPFGFPNPEPANHKIWDGASVYRIHAEDAATFDASRSIPPEILRMHLPQQQWYRKRRRRSPSDGFPAELCGVRLNRGPRLANRPDLAREFAVYTEYRRARTS